MSRFSVGVKYGNADLVQKARNERANAHAYLPYFVKLVCCDRQAITGLLKNWVDSFLLDEEEV